MILGTASSGFLLPVLLVLSIAQEVTPFSQTATRHLEWIPLQSLVLRQSSHRAATRRRLVLPAARQEKPQTIRWATPIQ